jgi:hypothetical protein
MGDLVDTWYFVGNDDWLYVWQVGNGWRPIIKLTDEQRNDLRIVKFINEYNEKVRATEEEE